MNGVPSEKVEAVKHFAIPLIQIGLEATESEKYFSAEWVIEECKKKNKQLWIGEGWVVVTQINKYPTGLKEIEIFLVAGHGMNDWYPEMVKAMMDFGKANGCSVIAGCGRLGWIRMAEKHFPKRLVKTYRVAQEI